MKAENSNANKADNIVLEVSATTLVCTTICTLRCRDCLLKIPYQEKKHTDFSLLQRSLEEYFHLVSRVSEFTIMGGEAFLHPQFADLMRFMDQYSDRIGVLFLITQASYLPSEEAVAAVARSKCNCMVHIDDYGTLSPKLDNVLEKLSAQGIKFDVRHYNEQEQYYGGWVDVVGDFSYQGYEDGGLDIYQRCKNKSECKFIWDGILYSCGMHGAGTKLGKVPLADGDYVDLLDSAMSTEEKQQIIRAMGTRPVEGCKYCLGWDVKKSPRIKAAIQLAEQIEGD